MKEVLIPANTLAQFVNVAKRNVDSNGKLVETLAFLIGYIDDEKIKATELLFPNQTGDASKVVDYGKIIFKGRFIFCRNYGKKWEISRRNYGKISVRNMGRNRRNCGTLPI
jgi:hypothetical protein